MNSDISDTKKAPVTPAESEANLSELNSLKETLEIKINEILTCNSTIKSLNSDFDSQRRKNDILMKEVVEHQKQSDIKSEKIKQHEKYCEKLKLKRDDYKKAWEKTEEKLRKIK